MNPETKVMLEAIAAERARQDKLWGVGQRHADGRTAAEVRELAYAIGMAGQLSTITVHPAQLLEDAMRQMIRMAKLNGREPRWLPIVMEELAEAINAVDDEHLEEELVQLAAVVCRWAETVHWRRMRARDLEPKPQPQPESKPGKVVA